MTVYFSTTNGERSGRNSKFFKLNIHATEAVEVHNQRAMKAGIAARYEVASCDSEGIEPKEIR